MASSARATSGTNLGQPQHLGPQNAVGHSAFGDLCHRRPVDPQPTTELGVQLVQSSLARRIGEEPIERGQRLVPGGSGAGPGFR